MTKERLGDISLDKLRKRRTITIVVLCLLVGVAIVSVVISLIKLVGGKQLDTGLLGGLIICLFFSIYFYTGTRNINREIRRRENT